MNLPRNADTLDTSGSSNRFVARKEPLSALHLRLNSIRDRGLRHVDSYRQDSSSGQDRTEWSVWDLVKKSVKQDDHPHHVEWTWARIRQDAKNVGAIVRSHPLVVFIPLLAWVLLMAGGIYAVLGTAARETDHRRQLAAQIASDKALFLQTELAKVFMPAYVTSVYVRHDPDWRAVNASFAPMALEMIRLSNAGSILTLSLIPNGVITTMVPLKGSSPADDPNWRAIGKDWLQDRFNQDKVLQAVSSSNLTIIGPYNLTQGGIGLVAMLSIRVPDTAPNASFNVPPYVHGALGPWQTPPRVQTGPNTTGTPFEPYMYDNATSSKWWGLTTVLISWDILRQKVMRLHDLEALGYRYVLSRPALNKELLLARPDLANSPHELAVAWSSGVQRVPPGATNNGAPPAVPGDARPLIYYDLHKRLDRPVVAHVLVEGAEMGLYLQPLAGWRPYWRAPLVAVVAVVALLLAAMLFVTLLNRRQHLGLLHAMIPKKVIKTIRRGDIFTESFDCVTILFSDIVSYTSMSAQMEPIQVVQMLDELYKEYDDLTEKHGLYKVETIGDAFMVVGGAPDPLEEVEAARRVAQMALDMVELTRTRVLTGGHVVRIRVGIHSGPTVAAVVGRKMPRYCLFGDTVNTASRMESNGAPMRIHVSGATAELLAQAGGFVLEPRGEIPIKGKGTMSTFWVPGNSSPSPGGASPDPTSPHPTCPGSFSGSLHPLPLTAGDAAGNSGDTATNVSIGISIAQYDSVPPLSYPLSPPPPRPPHLLAPGKPPALQSPATPLPPYSGGPGGSKPVRPSSVALRREVEETSEPCRYLDLNMPPRGPRYARTTAGASPLRNSSGQTASIFATERRSVDLAADEEVNTPERSPVSVLYRTHSNTTRSCAATGTGASAMSASCSVGPKDEAPTPQ